jgi:small-conductance mechanosensitive channel
MNEEIRNRIESFAFFLAIMVVTIVAAWLVDRLFKRFLENSSENIKSDPTNYQFLRHAVSGLIYVVGVSWAIWSVPSMRAIANSLLGAAGILAIAVGFASQHALANVVSGIFIVVFKPFRVNDRLRLRDNLSGVVEDITLRHTVIRDFENRRIIIPNSVISQEVIINSDFGDDKICKWFEIYISMDTNIDQAKAILFDEALKHPLRIDARKPEDIEKGKPEVTVRVLRVDEYGIRLRAWIWAKDTSDAFVISCEMYESVKKRFDEVGIHIPQVPRLKADMTPVVNQF